MPEKPVLDQLNLVVADVEKSVAFYRRLGVSFPHDVWRNAGGAAHVSSDGDAGVELGFDNPHFAQLWNQGWAGRNDLVGRMVLGFRVSSREAVDEHYRNLTSAGHVGLQAPYDAFWGARYAVIEDPDGIAVGLMSPTDPARRRPPPAT